MQNLTMNLDYWHIVKPYQRQKDGRNAFLALGHHYLGPSSIDNMASAAEANLEEVKYSWETKRWDFESYVKVHLECH